MEWQTKVLPEKDIEISHADNILFIGSCFAENMGQKFLRYGFSSLVNPFGILFNPISIAACFERSLSNKFIEEKELVFHNQLWHSFLHHGVFSRKEKEECISICNESIIATNSFLKGTTVIIITFGTAFVYYSKKGEMPVANCHKISGTEFVKKLSTVGEIVHSYERIIHILQKSQPEIKILYTVSPIRHWKDGYRENQISKSILHLAIKELQDKFSCVHYFPSYEIVMDELRDYRFYAEDMLHLTKTTVDYIWEKFSQTYFSPKTNSIIFDIEKYRRMEEHRSINKIFEQEHLEKTVLYRKDLLEKYPLLKIN